MGRCPCMATSSSLRATGTSPSTSQPLHDPYEIASCSAASADRHDHRIMAGYPVHRPANPWHGHRLLRRANIQPSATTGLICPELSGLQYRTPQQVRDEYLEQQSAA